MALETALGVSVDAVSASQERSSGSPLPSRPRSWSLPVPEGAYGRIVAWRGREHWLAALTAVLGTPEGEAVRASRKVARRTVLAIAAEYAERADIATGRSVTVAHDTVGAAVERCAKTIQRATRTLEALGFAVTVVEGRYLYADEREAARALHQSVQLRAASVLALTLPAVDKSSVNTKNVHLPVNAQNPLSTYKFSLKQTRASAQSEAASRPEPRQKKDDAVKQVRPVPQVRPITRQRFLAQLDRHYGNALARGRHIGQIDQMLRRAGVAESWSLRELTQRIATRFPAAHEKLHAAEDPLRYFAWMIRQTIQPGETPPAIVSEKRARELQAQRAHAAREREAERQRRASLSPGEFDRIRAESDAAIRARDEARRRERATSPRAISDVLLGVGRHAFEFPQAVQDLHQKVLDLHAILTGRGWSIDVEGIEHGDVQWTWEPSRSEHVDDDHNPVTEVWFRPPESAPADLFPVLNLAGQRTTDTAISLAQLYARLDAIEAHRAGRSHR